MRPYRRRNKDNQRENRQNIKEEYPELQYRSPLAQPGPNKTTNLFVFSNHFFLIRKYWKWPKGCELSLTLLQGVK